MNEWPNRIREIRQQRGMSQQELADLMHTSKMTVSSLERGRIELSLHHLRRIAHIFGLTAIDLLNPDDQNALLRVEEMELVRRYREADPVQREMIHRVAEPRLNDLQSPAPSTSDTDDRSSDPRGSLRAA